MSSAGSERSRPRVDEADIELGLMSGSDYLRTYILGENICPQVEVSASSAPQRQENLEINVVDADATPAEEQSQEAARNVDDHSGPQLASSSSRLNTPFLQRLVKSNATTAVPNSALPTPGERLGVSPDHLQLPHQLSHDGSDEMPPESKTAFSVSAGRSVASTLQSDAWSSRTKPVQQQSEDEINTITPTDDWTTGTPELQQPAGFPTAESTCPDVQQPEAVGGKAHRNPRRRPFIIPSQNWRPDPGQFLGPKCHGRRVLDWRPTMIKVESLVILGLIGAGMSVVTGVLSWVAKYHSEKVSLAQSRASGNIKVILTLLAMFYFEA